MASANSNVRRGERLKSWKEIAAFFGTDERTVRRWEGRGLPVQRIPGGARATVYAEVAELQRWMRGRDIEASAGQSALPPKRHRRTMAGVAALTLAGAAAIVLWPGRPPMPPAASAHRAPARAVDLYLQATYDRERRTPAGLEQARDLFGRAIAEDPAYAEAYAGLAKTYLLLREYSVMPDADAYARAGEAAERALSLDPKLADAEAVRAFVTFFWTRDWARGLAGFERATQLDPMSADAWHWYGTALFHAGRFDAAMRALGEAQEREPASRSIVADKALVAYHAGRRAEGVAELRRLAASEPEFYSPHYYLSQIEFADGDPSIAMQETQAAARIRGDPEAIVAAGRAEQAFRLGGRVAVLRAMLAGEEARRRAGKGSDYQLAALHALLGEKEPALRFLAASDAAGESLYVAVRVDLRFRGLGSDARFRQLQADVERPPPSRA
ncbi:MAG TPA: hypothetical protein VGF77_13115 [Allosphingosinicella sp.]|jgi:Tfp pilus assembly protein PilF